MNKILYLTFPIIILACATYASAQTYIPSTMRNLSWSSGADYVAINCHQLNSNRMRCSADRYWLHKKSKKELDHEFNEFLRFISLRRKTDGDQKIRQEICSVKDSNLGIKNICSSKISDVEFINSYIIYTKNYIYNVESKTCLISRFASLFSDAIFTRKSGNIWTYSEMGWGGSKYGRVKFKYVFSCYKNTCNINDWTFYIYQNSLLKLKYSWNYTDKYTHVGCEYIIGIN